MYLNKKSFGQSIMVCQILLMNLMDICKLIGDLKAHVMIKVHTDGLF